MTNPSQSVEWFPALAVLAVGLLAGTLIILRLFAVSQRAARPGPRLPLQLRDLAGRRDALLRQLREMEDTASKRTPEQLARERYALELETARVLLALDERGASEHARRAPERSAKSRRSASARPDHAGVRRFLWGAGIAIPLLLLGLFVGRSAKPRDPGGSVTGEAPREARDVDARLELVRESADRQDWMRVWKEAARILEQSPGHTEALAYQAIVRLVVGQNDVAVDLLKKSIAADPDLAVAYAYLVIGQLRMGRVRDAAATAAGGSERFPERAAEFQQLIEEHKGDAAPGGGGGRVAGTVDIEPSLKGTVAPRAILFVFARAAGSAGGPPVAVKRLPATFPAAFELTDADSMMGQPLPDRLLVEARLDSDGDPTTRSPADPKARLDGVKNGRTDLRLILRR